MMSCRGNQQLDAVERQQLAYRLYYGNDSVVDGVEEDVGQNQDGNERPLFLSARDFTNQIISNLESRRT